MTAPTNKPQSDPTKTQGSVPSPGVPGYGEVPKIVWSQIEGDGWLNCCYVLDGKYGWAKTNGEMAIHFDTLNNMIFTAGFPGESGCGGKMINVSKGGKIDKHSSVSIEVTGRQDDGKLGKTTTDKGTTEETKVPAYSLKVYGDILIECIGGEVAIKGDNVTLNAASTLNLKSGKDINIQAGEKSGRINLNGGALNINTAHLNKNVSGLESSTGAAEVSTEQYHKGASNTISTPGSIKYTVNGDYELGVTGKVRQLVSKSYEFNVDGDYAQVIKGNRSDKVQGKYKLEVNGTETKPASSQQENYLIKVGAGKSKTVPSYSIISGSGAKISSTTGNFIVEVAKQVGLLDLSEKSFKVSAGKSLGSLELTEKETVLAFGKANKISISPAKLSIVATAIYLN
jgi:hypothetical protein